MSILSLRAGRLALDLAPDCGGSIARFAVEGKGDVLRPASAEALASGKGNNTACYPLVPYSNRIAEGRLRFDGEEVMLAPNWPGQRHPMHGDGWSHPWQVTHHDETLVELTYQHDGSDGWPFRYRAQQTFRLGDDSLAIDMSISNLETRTVPAGMGLHPFFTRDPDSELTCRASGVWLTDAEIIPTGRIAIPPGWDFSQPRRIDEAVLDNCFDGWSGFATVSWPSRRLAVDLIAITPLDHLVIYTPEHRSFFCVEPVSHISGAVGSMLLPRGLVRHGTVVFAVRNL